MANNWSREETIVAFNVYCKIPFQASSSRHPDVIKYANIIGRSPAALNMEIGNFGRLDPALRERGITGLVHGRKLEEIVWNEFHGNWSELAFESECFIANMQNKQLEESLNIEVLEFPEGKDRKAMLKTRIKQSFFRSTILASYQYKCCISGLSIPELLIASHIIPWSQCKKERLNPKNGLCLNPIHDKAFDKGYLTITADYKVQISQYLKDVEHDKAVVEFFIKLEGVSINLPNRFLPSKENLSYHHEKVFIQ
ncbi:MAG: HNH endonuclease [Mariprofundaceae bacterium]|nr:HNH endonuclease [Mariprofundaceae bacterium]